MRVTRIDLHLLHEPSNGTARDWWSTTPLDILYDPAVPHLDRRQPGAEEAGVISNVVVQLHTDDGLSGVANVGAGSPAAAAVIEHHLAPLVLGHDPFELELLWQTMFRHTLNIGRKGLAIEALSAIDIALWDIVGKATDQPVYNLLGGRTRAAIRAYASQLYAREDLDALAAEARGYVDEGYTAVKMRFGYGPQDGRRGMLRNRELVATVRDAIGDDVELAAEAYMGWDETYAIAMIRMIEEYGLAWVEEPVLPDHVEAYARIRRSVSTPISGGEHEFTLQGFHRLLQANAVDIIQPDVNRMGGITEARKVWALAEAHGIRVVPHGNQAHNAHLIIASLGSPLIEVFPDDSVRPGYKLHQEFFDGEPRAHGGWVEVSDRPGLGLELNADAIERHKASDLTLEASPQPR